MELIYFDYSTAQQEEVVLRVRYPRHVGRDGLVRPYVAHEAMGFYILNVNFISILIFSFDFLSIFSDWKNENTRNRIHILLI